MKNLKLSLCLALGLLAGVSSSAFAVAPTVSTTFKVKITITNSCDAAALAANDVDFGSHSFLDSNITASTSLSVKCTNGAPYTIALNAGLNAGTPGDVTTRRMLNGASNFIPYNLYQDSALASVWGSTTGTNTIASTGTGVAQSFPVYAKALPGNVPAGLYVDTVQATVTY